VLEGVQETYLPQHSPSVHIVLNHLHLLDCDHLVQFLILRHQDVSIGTTTQVLQALVTSRQYEWDMVEVLSSRFV
jgi:hypothetical protein